MDSNQVKTFWQRPEGLTAKIIVVALLAVVGFAFVHFLPFIIALADNMIHLGISLGILALMGMIVTADRPRTLLFYALASISRAITKNFVAIDPIGILRAFVVDMQEKRKTVKTAIESMMTVRNKSTEQFKLKERELNDALKLADAAKKTGNAEKFQELTERAGRRNARMTQLKEAIGYANDTIATLQRVDRVIEYQINTKTDEADDMESDYENAIAMLAATHAANEALGDSDKLTVSNMAVDVVRDKVAKATASVDSLMENIRSVQGDMDLNNLVLMQDGVNKLNELRSSVDQQEQGQIKKGTARVLTSGEVSSNIPSSGNKWADRLNNHS